MLYYIHSIMKQLYFLPKNVLVMFTSGFSVLFFSGDICSIALLVIVLYTHEITSLPLQKQIKSHPLTQNENLIQWSISVFEVVIVSKVLNVPLFCLCFVFLCSVSWFCQLMKPCCCNVLLVLLFLICKAKIYSLFSNHFHPQHSTV